MLARNPPCAHGRMSHATETPDAEMRLSRAVGTPRLKAVHEARRILPTMYGGARSAPYPAAAPRDEAGASMPARGPGAGSRALSMRPLRLPMRTKTHASTGSAGPRKLAGPCVAEAAPPGRRYSAVGVSLPAATSHVQRILLGSTLWDRTCAWVRAGRVLARSRTSQKNQSERAIFLELRRCNGIRQGNGCYPPRSPDQQPGDRSGNRRMFVSSID